MHDKTSCARPAMLVHTDHRVQKPDHQHSLPNCVGHQPSCAADKAVFIVLGQALSALDPCGQGSPAPMTCAILSLIPAVLTAYMQCGVREGAGLAMALSNGPMGRDGPAAIYMSRGPRELTTCTCSPAHSCKAPAYREHSAGNHCSTYRGHVVTREQRNVASNNPTATPTSTWPNCIGHREALGTASTVRTNSTS